MDQIEKPDLIVAFGFSKHGGANETIATIASYNSIVCSVPVFTQLDIAHEMTRPGMAWPVACAYEGNGYLSTLGFCKQVKDFSDHRNLTTVQVVAAPMHRWRCVRDLKRVGLRVIEPPDKVVISPENEWYYSRDPQVWVRNGFFWWMRESCIRILPWFLYSRIAG